MAEDGSGTGDDAPSIELVGVIVGAICLFGVIGVIPLYGPPFLPAWILPLTYLYSSGLWGYHR